MKLSRTVGLAVTVSLVAGTVAAFAQISGAAPAGPIANVVDAVARAGAPVVEGWPADTDPVQQAESFGFHVQLFFAFQQPDQDDAGKLSAFIAHEHRRMAARAASFCTASTSGPALKT